MREAESRSPRWLGVRSSRGHSRDKGWKEGGFRKMIPGNTSRRVGRCFLERGGMRHAPSSTLPLGQRSSSHWGALGSPSEAPPSASPTTPRGAGSWGIYSQLRPRAWRTLISRHSWRAVPVGTTDSHRQKKGKWCRQMLAVEVGPLASADMGRAEGSGQPGAMNRKYESSESENKMTRQRGVASGARVPG